MNINQILKKEIELISLEKEELGKINKISKEFCNELSKKLKAKKIKADVFVGGSLAKNTLIKKRDAKYDVDIFVRFSGYDNGKISDILGKVLGKTALRVHGSRDYYQIKKDNIILEIIPVIKIKNPADAKNVTDLSYFHVNHILKCFRKNKRINNEIRLAKAFAHANDCYGAESYIKGFSGYALELLICHYKSFLKFVKAITLMKEGDKVIIDDSKFYKKREALIEMNESKIMSPIILVDPTFKERNALAGLSNETFLRFRKACLDFLKNPSLEAFLRKGVFENFEKIKEVKIVSVKTEKQVGDIAGTKSKKFFDFFVSNIEREFIVKKKGFDYDDEKNIAYYYLVIDSKGKEIVRGPPVSRTEHLSAFKKVHANAFIKGDFAFAEISHNISFEEWLKRFLEKDKKIIKAMAIKDVRVVK